MAGHSKWKQIKHKKAATDAKRGAAFTKLIKEITVAARQGGGDPAANARLRTAVDAARSANMPSENIERAIKKGTGELAGVSYEEATYEGYGPGGAAIIVLVTTDNLNRTVAELRHAFSKHGGSLSEPNAVAWQFTKRGQIELDATVISEEQALEAALECGADDMTTEDDRHLITTKPEQLHAVRDALTARGLQPLEAELALLPNVTVQVSGEDAVRLVKLVNTLDDHDDVAKVFSNFDVDAETLAAVNG